MKTTSLLLNGVMFGLGAAVPIGPVNVEIARRALRGGFLAGVALGCGAVSVDISYTILYAIGFSSLTRYPAIYWSLAIAGVALLMLLGILSLRSARLVWRERALLEQSGAPSIHGGYLTGLLMTATNPMTIAFWFTILPALAGRITTQPRHDLPIICMGVFLGAIGWVLTFSALLSFAGRFRKPWWMTAADEAGGVMLLGLACVALLRAMRGPL